MGADFGKRIDERINPTCGHVDHYEDLWLPNGFIRWCRRCYDTGIIITTKVEPIDAAPQG